MRALDLRTVEKAVGGRLSSSPDKKVSGVGTDSRDLKGNDLFVALKGEYFDGHKFLSSAAKAGAKAAVVERGNESKIIFNKENPDFPLVEVEDTLLALGDLAAYYRKTMKMVVVGITGTTGKTCTKDILVSILGREKKVCYSEGSLNNEIGVPLTVLKAGRADEILVCELGARHPGDIKRLAEIVKPEYGILTNIGPGHLEIFGDQKTVAETKCELAEALPETGSLSIKAGDEWTRFISRRTKAKIVKFGFSKSASYRAVNVKQDQRGGYGFTIEGPELKLNITLPVAGRHNIENALAAVSCAHEMGVGAENIALGLKNAKVSKWRTQLQRAPLGYLIINDSYNANPQSMIAALETLSELGGTKRKIAVIGDMAELGEYGPGYHYDIGREIAGMDIDVLIAVGPKAKMYADGALERGFPKGSVFRGDDFEKALDFLRDIAEPDDVVLVKASRVIGLDRVVSSILGNGSVKEKRDINV